MAVKRLQLSTKKEAEKTKSASIKRIISIVLLILVVGVIVYEVAIKEKKATSDVSVLSEFTNPFVDIPKEGAFAPNESIKTEELGEIKWRDNPVELAKYYAIEAFFLGTPNRVRINHKLYSSGDFLDENFRIVKIEPPLVVLSDKNGELHRLVHRRDWKYASDAFNWREKDLYNDYNDIDK